MVVQICPFLPFVTLYTEEPIPLTKSKSICRVNFAIKNITFLDYSNMLEALVEMGSSSKYQESSKLADDEKVMMKLFKGMTPKKIFDSIIQYKPLDKKTFIKKFPSDEAYKTLIAGGIQNIIFYGITSFSIYTNKDYQFYVRHKGKQYDTLMFYGENNAVHCAARSSIACMDYLRQIKNF